MRPFVPRAIAALALLLTLTLQCVPAAAGSDIGIVVLHGKQGMAGDRPTAPFLQALRGAGYNVQAPTLCWSRLRDYDAAFPDCLRDIDTAITALHAAGARRIVVAGMSLGGDAAIVYGAQHPELAGVIALAPAAQPQQMIRNPMVAQSVAQARQMVAAGQGNQRSSFSDVNDGPPFALVSTAAIYLSFHEVGGPADFPLVLPRLREPVIWVAGTQDRTQTQAAALFARLPPNPLNRFVQVGSAHLETPAAGTAAVLTWLQALPAQ
jgi:pimeloyl-ACP methyl ester carboxylesterase